MIRSLVTFAIIDAAAIEKLFESKFQEE